MKFTDALDSILTILDCAMGIDRHMEQAGSSDSEHCQWLQGCIMKWSRTMAAEWAKLRAMGLA